MILAFAGVIGTTLLAGVPLFVYLTNLLKDWQKGRKERAAAQITQAAEIKKIGADEHREAMSAVWKLYEDCQRRCEGLEKGNSLTNPTVSRIYSKVRNLRREIDILDSIFIKEFDAEEYGADGMKLKTAIDSQMLIVRQTFDEVEKVLP